MYWLNEYVYWNYLPVSNVYLIGVHACVFLWISLAGQRNRTGTERAVSPTGHTVTSNSWTEVPIAKVVGTLESMDQHQVSREKV